MANMYIVTEEELTATADSIRQKTGTTTQLEWEEDNGFKSAIEAIPSGDQIEIANASCEVILPGEGSANISLDVPTITIASAVGELVV